MLNGNKLGWEATTLEKMVIEGLSKEVTLELRSQIILSYPAASLTDNGISLPSFLHSFLSIIKNSDLLLSSLVSVQEYSFLIDSSLNLDKIQKKGKTINKATCHSHAKLLCSSEENPEVN